MINFLLFLSLVVNPAARADLELLGLTKEVTQADRRFDCSGGPTCTWKGSTFGPFPVKSSKIHFRSNSLERLGLTLDAAPEAVAAWLTSVKGLPAEGALKSSDPQQWTHLWEFGPNQQIMFIRRDADGSSYLGLVFLPPVPVAPCSDERSELPGSTMLRSAAVRNVNEDDSC